MAKRSLLVLFAVVLLVSCRSAKKLVIGSKNGTEQTLLAEIAAQHLERRLQTQVDRRFAIGDTIITHQSLVTGQIDMYPEYTGTLSSVVLKEIPASDAAILYERTRGEMASKAQAEFIGPLGFNSPDVVVIDSTNGAGIETLSDAAKGKMEWKIGVPTEFQQKLDGLSNLNKYQLPMGAPVRATEGRQLFPLLEKRELTMVISNATDGHLASGKWKVLKDDLGLFSPQQAGLLVRNETLSSDPRIRAALLELVGKILPDTIRRLNSEVDVEKKPVGTVAAEFLASVGLK